MGKIIRRTLTALLIVILALSAAIVGAVIKPYTATGEDYANEVESQDIAKLRARDKAIKKATKQAGVYLKSYSRSVNSELTDDEVTAITSNAWQLVGEPKYSSKIVKGSDETSIIIWTATVEVNVDDSEIQSWIKRDDKDKSTIISQTREAQKSAEENERKIEDLREKYNRATSQAEKDNLRKQMTDADRDFLANQKLEEGNKLVYAKDYYGAIKIYREAIKLKPDWSWPYNNRGLAYSDLGQKERAIQDYDKAIQLNPNLAEVYNNRGCAYDSLGQKERAIQDFNKAIQLNPNDDYAYNNRGVAYKNLNQNERAIQDYNKAIELNPNDVAYYYNRGNAYDDLGKSERAIQDYNKAIELNPNDAAYYCRGIAYGRLKKYERAIQDYDKAIEINPNNVEAYNNRGNAYRHLGQYEKAISDATKAIQINPNFVTAYMIRGTCYQELGDEAKAQADFAKAKELGWNG